MHEVSSLLMGKFSLESNGSRKPGNKGTSESTIMPPDRMKAPGNDIPAQQDDGRLQGIIEDLKKQLEEKENKLSKEEREWLEKKSALKARVLKLEEESAHLKEKLEEESAYRIGAIAEERAAVLEKEKELERKKEELEQKLEALKKGGNI